MRPDGYANTATRTRSVRAVSVEAMWSTGARRRPYSTLPGGAAPVQRARAAAVAGSTLANWLAPVMVVRSFRQVASVGVENWPDRAR